MKSLKYINRDTLAHIYTHREKNMMYMYTRGAAAAAAGIKDIVLLYIRERESVERRWKAWR